MATYITLIKAPSDALGAFGDVDKLYEQIKKTAKLMGIKIVTVCGVLGPYDMMLVYEAADERAAMKFTLAGQPRPGVYTETWAAIPMDDFVKLAGPGTD